MIAPRDFTYMRTRFQQAACEVGDVSYTRICGGMAYSVDETHPLNEKTKKDHVRGQIVMSGHVLSQRADAPQGTFDVCYILAMDPKGMIPQWIVNQFAPAKGMEVLKFAKDWAEMNERMQKREARGWKKDHEPMFEPHPKLSCADKGQKDAVKDVKGDEDNKDDQ